MTKTMGRSSERETRHAGEAELLGARLRAARREAGLSQSDVGRALGYAPSLISALESGDRRLKVDDLTKLCALYGRSADYFLHPEAAVEREQVGVSLRAQLSGVPHEGLSEALGEFLDYAELEFAKTGETPAMKGVEPQEAAKRILKKAEIGEAPVDLDRIVRALHIPVISWSFPDALSALLADTEAGGFVIGVNRSHSLNRRRFSIAHECGHAVLRHQAGFYLEFTDVDPFGEEQPATRYKDERAANAFGAALLMPKAWLRKDCQGGMDAPTLAARYRVSEEAMSFRLRNLGLARAG